MADALVTAYVGAGSSIDPAENLARGVAELAATCRLLRVSTVYRTPALDRPDDPDFLNAVVAVEAACGARELKYDVLRAIESRLGRTRTADPYAPRTIDLDLLLYGDEVLDDGDVGVPDADIRTRAFLAAGLVELDPELRLPDTGEHVAGLAIMREAHALATDREATQRLKEACHGSRKG